MPGGVKKFRFKRCALKVPHMGWNNIRRALSVERRASEILKGVADGSYMYFVHSYYAVPEDKGVVLTTTDYGGLFASGVAKDNIFGFQFHPEKSQEMGLRIMKNFVRVFK